MDKHAELMKRFKALSFIYGLLALGYEGLFIARNHKLGQTYYKPGDPILFYLSDDACVMTGEEGDDEDACEVTMFKVVDKEIIGVTNGDYDIDMSTLPDDLLEKFLDDITEQRNVIEVNYH